MTKCNPKELRRFLATALVICWAQLAAPQTHYRVLPQTVIETRLKSFAATDEARGAALKSLFQQSGCTGEALEEQSVGKKQPPNVICTMRGETDDVIVVGGHFDHVSKGDGVIDNWSGASLLPSHYMSLSGFPIHHTFVFVGFMGEEQSMLGSKFYVKRLSREQRLKIKAMLNLETLGLSTTEVWATHADKELLNAIYGVAQYLKLPISSVNVDRVGTTDSESFADAKIPRITIHSLTQETLGVLHSPKDRLSAVKFPEYYDSYRLIIGYIAYLVTKLPSANSFPTQNSK